MDPRSPEGALHYPKLNKIRGKIFKLLKNGKFPNLLANKSRASREMANSFVRLRKQFGITEVAEEFRTFANADGKVYIIRNDTE